MRKGIMDNFRQSAPHASSAEIARAKQTELLLTEIEHFEQWIAQLTALVELELPQEEFVPRWLAGLKDWTLERKRAQSRLNWRWNTKDRNPALIDRDLRRLGRKAERARAAIAEARRRMDERKAQAERLAEALASLTTTAARTPASETSPRKEAKTAEVRQPQHVSAAPEVPLRSGGRDLPPVATRNPAKLNPTARALIERDLEIDVMTTSDDEIATMYMKRHRITREQAQQYVDGLHDWPPAP